MPCPSSWPAQPANGKIRKYLRALSENQLCIKAIFSSFMSEGNYKSLNPFALILFFKKGCSGVMGRIPGNEKCYSRIEENIYKAIPLLASGRIFVSGEYGSWVKRGYIKL